MHRSEPAVHEYCVDLAKAKFQVHGYSQTGTRLLQKVLSRSQFITYFFGRLGRRGAQVVMEACGSSHHWGRRFQASGYGVTLVPPQFVAKQRMGNKTDGNDADSIHAVHGDPRVRAVPVKSLEQQDLCALHRQRERLMRQRTQCINQARGLLAERGCVAATGGRGFAALLQSLQTPTAEVTPILVQVIEQIAAQIRGLEQQVASIDRMLGEYIKQSPVAALIDSIHGVGVVTATAFDAQYGGRIERFADARQFAASLGITPREDSSGQRRRLGSITKRGNPYLRQLLVQCAQSVVNTCATRQDTLSQLAYRLLARRPRNTVVIAIANRLARIIYAVIKHREPYRPQARTA